MLGRVVRKKQNRRMRSRNPVRFLIRHVNFGNTVPPSGAIVAQGFGVAVS